MTENDVSRYELELIRSAEAITDVVNDTNQYTQPQIVYTQSPTQSGINGISVNIVIIVLAVVIGIVAIAYSRNCNCGK